MTTTGGRFDLARDLFERALRLDSAARAAMLDEACGPDAALRAEVEDLLRLDASGPPGLTGPGGVGEGPSMLARALTGTIPGAWDADGEDPRDAAPPPQRVGPFRVVRELGRGAMGIVYEAEQDEPRRRVALKVIHPGVVGPGALRRFRRETRVLAALRHPGIVQLLEIGTAVGDGGAGGADADQARPYLAMELVEGVTLREYAAGGPPEAGDAGGRPRAGGTPPLDERLALVAQICDAVHHAHQKGVVHRDLKPENILVQPAPTGTDAGTRTAAGVGVAVKILDFGVSRLLEDAAATGATGPGGAGATLATHAGHVVGTVPYLSPEQAAGDPQGTDTRSDVYAIGVVAFELIAGVPPFAVAGLAPGAAIRTILSGEPRRLKAAAPGVPADVATIVHKAMAREPAERYPSAAELGADVRRFLAREPILARAPSWAYVTSMFVRRHRALAAVASASLVLLVVAAAGMTALWADASRTRRAAEWSGYLSAMGAASAAVAAGDIGTARRHLEATPPVLRGWEYRHLASRLDQSRAWARPAMAPPFSLLPRADGSAVLVGATGPGEIDLRAAAAGPAGAALSVRAIDPRLTLWYGALAGRLPSPIPIDGPRVHVPDGAGVRELALSDWPRWKVLVVNQAAVSADGSTMALLVADRARHAVAVVRLADGRTSVLDRGPDARVVRLALSSDGSRLLVATTDPDPWGSRLVLMDAPGLTELSRSPALGRTPFSIAMDAGGRWAVAVLQSGAVLSWAFDGPAATPAAGRAYDHDAAENLRLSPDGTLLASGSRDGLVRVFAAGSLDLVAELRGHESEIFDVAFAGPSTVVSAGADGSLRVWDAAPPPRRPLVVDAHNHLVHGVAIAERSRRLFTGGWDRVVAASSLDTGERLGSAPAGDLVAGLALSPDERLLAVREMRGRVAILDARTLEPVGETRMAGGWFDQPAFDAASRRLLVGYDPASATATVWSRDGGVVQVPGAELDGFVGPMLGHPSRLVALTGERTGGFTVAVHDYATGHARASFPVRRAASEAIAFSADGRRFAVADDQNVIIVYDSSALVPVGRFRGHTREVLAMAFAPDGSRFFSADLTGVIRVWDARTFDEVAQLRGHDSHVRRLVVSADGRTLVSGSRDGTARVWTAPPPTPGP